MGLPDEIYTNPHGFCEHSQESCNEHVMGLEAELLALETRMFKTQKRLEFWRKHLNRARELEKQATSASAAAAQTSAAPPAQPPASTTPASGA